MTRVFKVVVGAGVLLVLLVGGLVGYRALTLRENRTPEGYRLLAAVANSESFEPPTTPTAPVLANQSAKDLAVDFGYRVADVSYSYALTLAFPPGGEEGRAKLVARHDARSAALDVPVVRRWDEPRHAYAVALSDRFAAAPAVPALCIKAVIGPSLTTYDLKDATLCIAQRDTQGGCHPETLACGVIRR